MQLMSKHMFKIRDRSRNKVIGHIQLTHFITKEILSSNNLPPFHMFALQYLSQVHHEVLFRDRIQYPKMWRPHGIQVRDTAVHGNGGPQLSQQQQITHSNNKLITTTTKNSHQNRIPTEQTNTLTEPRSRGGIFCLVLDLKKEGVTCLSRWRSLPKFLTSWRGYSIFFGKV